MATKGKQKSGVIKNAQDDLNYKDNIELIKDSLPRGSDVISYQTFYKKKPKAKLSSEFIDVIYTDKIYTYRSTRSKSYKIQVVECGI